LAKATEPFFTTKGTGKGTGLGLSMVHGLAMQSGGAMRITSKLDQGTTIDLWLPEAEHEEAEAAAGAAGRAERPPSVAPLRVLLVDDDPLVRVGTSALLDDLGHVVTEAESANDAVQVLRGGERFDLVITDQAMPGMSGTELARIIGREFPALKVILATGFADSLGEADRKLARLSKPYTQSEVAHAIALAMDPKLAAVAD
jgi:CheY-like chemotaxis protein